MRNARKKWEQAKTNSDQLHQQFLSLQAEEYAAKLNTSHENVLKASLRAEDSKQTFRQINLITQHKNEKLPLTMIDILDSNGQRNTHTSKDEIEQAILRRNQMHARQSLKTPFATKPALSKTINPLDPANRIDELLNGTFLELNPNFHNLSDIEKTWIQELEQKLSATIDTPISTEDFIQFFTSCKDRSSSSPSGRHMGHYKVIAELAGHEQTIIAEIITMIINISIMTSRPLRRWQRSSQIMIDKGKGKYIENL